MTKKQFLKITSLHITDGIPYKSCIEMMISLAKSPAEAAEKIVDFNAILIEKQFPSKGDKI